MFLLLPREALALQRNMAPATLAVAHASEVELVETTRLSGQGLGLASQARALLPPLGTGGINYLMTGRRTSSPEAEATQASSLSVAGA